MEGLPMGASLPNTKREQAALTMRASAVLWLLVVATPALADDSSVVHSCEATHDGDLDHEACYGWCSASQAADHCSWCKVRAHALNAHPVVVAHVPSRSAVQRLSMVSSIRRFDGPRAGRGRGRVPIGPARRHLVRRLPDVLQRGIQGQPLQALQMSCVRILRQHLLLEL
tara:strand:- start:206 stop:715 length:510 start_codon:yes stop_codon:yes gene_type:complete